MNISLLIGGALSGLLVGLLPFFIAKKREKKQYAIGSLIACSIGGAVLGLLLSVPLALILTGFALRFPKVNLENNNVSVEGEAEDENKEKTGKAKIFFSGFVPAFVGTIAWPFVNGRGADSFQELLTIYLFIPLIVGAIAGGIMLLVKRNKPTIVEEKT